ncbi:hypothetical protein T07_14476, partial [Trichinella nelsoni]
MDWGRKQIQLCITCGGIGVRVRNFEWVVQGYGVRKRFRGIGDVWVVSGGQ